MMSRYFIAASINNEIINNSSSGGIFSELAKIIINEDGIVCGAMFDSVLQKVKHVVASCYAEIQPMRKSKYVWSEYTDVFNEIEDAINKNKSILFTGTPCQCNSVKRRYKDYGKFYTMSVFCHGTSESWIFKKYIENFLTNCKHIDFRGEKGTEVNFFFTAKDSNNKELINESYAENYFAKLYIDSASIRKCCFNCEFANREHSSDITVGDWEYKDYAKKRGIKAKHPSIVAINNDRGLKLWNQIKDNLEYIEEDCEDKIQFYYRNRQQIVGPWGYNIELRDKFQSMCLKYGFKIAIYRYLFPEITGVLDCCIEKNHNKVYLYGAGNVAYKYIEIIKEIFTDIEIKGILLTNKNQSDIYGISIYELGDIRLRKDELIIIATSNKYIKDIENNLVEHFGDVNQWISCSL